MLAVRGGVVAPAGAVGAVATGGAKCAASRLVLDMLRARVVASAMRFWPLRLT